jgi:hypothetical protein
MLITNFMHIEAVDSSWAAKETGTHILKLVSRIFRIKIPF